jgi:predicted LPLAT superfamily acyltransferase
VTQPAPADRHWQQQREGSTAFMMRCLFGCALLLGRRITRLILWPTVLYFLIAGRSARTASRDYLSRVLPHPVRMRDIARHFYTFAACVLDRVYFLAGRYRSIDVQVHGAEHVFNALHSSPGQAKRGALLLVAHFGSFEVLRTLGQTQHRLPISLLMDREHGRMLTQLLERLDPTLRANIIDASQSGPDLVLALNEAINAGHLVGVMADRARLQERTHTVRFLGAAAEFPVAPWLLASALKVPVILGLGVYHGGNRYSSHFELLAERVHIPRNQRESAVQEYVQAYANRLADYAQGAPYNWFNFYRFWLPS